MTWEQELTDDGIERHKNEAIDRRVSVYKRPEGQWMFIAQSITPGKYLYGETCFTREEARDAMRDYVELVNSLM